MEAMGQRRPPFQVAEDTWVIRHDVFPPGAPFGISLNSLVIGGREPVVVDTGVPRPGWLEDVASVVDPERVRHIFLSHEDVDHIGNLPQALTAFVNADVLGTWFLFERTGDHPHIPLERQRWFNHGDRMEIGDRVIEAFRPPFYDNPVTRGLLDHRTGVYWAVDSFMTPLAQPIDRADEVPLDRWAQGVDMGSRMIAPWHQLLDPRRFEVVVDAMLGKGIRTITSCHGPAITGDRVRMAIEMLRDIPGAEPAPVPTQADLDALIARTTGHAEAA